MIAVKKALIAFIVIVITVLFSSCGSDDDSPEIDKTITIGALFNESAIASKSSFMVAIDEINESGGVGDGYTIAYDVRNHGSSLQVADIATDMLNNTNIVGFVTSWSSRSIIVTEEVANPNKMGVIANASTADIISGLSPYFHRVAPPDRFQAKVLATEAVKEGITKVAIVIQAGDNYSEGIATQFKQNFGESGIVTEISFEENDTDMASKIEQLYASQPDAVLIAMVDNEVFIPFLQKVEESTTIGDKSNFRFLMVDAQQTENLLGQAPKSLLVGNTASGVLKAFGTAPFPDVTDQNYIHFVDLLKEKYNLDPVSFNAQAYDAAYIFCIAIQRVLEDGIKPENLETFRDAVNDHIRLISGPDSGDNQVNPAMGWNGVKAVVNLGDVDYQGASGNCDINTDGDVISNYDIYKVVDNLDGTFSFFTIANLSPN